MALLTQWERWRLYYQGQIVSPDAKLSSNEEMGFLDQILDERERSQNHPRPGLFLVGLIGVILLAFVIAREIIRWAEFGTGI